MAYSCACLSTSAQPAALDVLLREIRTITSSPNICAAEFASGGSLWEGLSGLAVARIALMRV